MPKGIYKDKTKYAGGKVGRKSWKMSEDAKKKMSISHIGLNTWSKGMNVGEKSPLWIKDRTKLKTERNHAYDTKYKYWMREVKKRDNWKCKINNKECNGRLEAHHILGWRDYPELRYQLNNGISLCKYHHPYKRSEEIRLSPYFQELLNLNK